MATDILAAILRMPLRYVLTGSWLTAAGLVAVAVLVLVGACAEEAVRRRRRAGLRAQPATDAERAEGSNDAH